MKRLIAVILLLAIMLTVPAPTLAADTVQEITLAGHTTVPVGGTVRWSASVLPQDASNQTIIWKSWYPAVASVSADGTITGHKAGQAHISAIAANGVKKTCTVTVVETAVTDIKLAGITNIEVGDIVTWSASVLPETATSKTVVWKSWNTGVATVDSNGNITGHKTGQAHISAIAANGVKKTCTIFVTNPHTTYHTAGSSYDHTDEPTETYSYGVYITRTGAKYHRGSCRYLRKSKIAISLSAARASGYTACSVCRP